MILTPWICQRHCLVLLFTLTTLFSGAWPEWRGSVCAWRPGVTVCVHIRMELETWRGSVRAWRPGVTVCVHGDLMETWCGSVRAWRPGVALYSNV